jgi:hypothetical protein
MPASNPIMPGTRFNRWIALEETKTHAYPCGKNVLFHLCRCDCGSVQFVGATKLKSGHSKSCGCLLSEITAKRSFKHGHDGRGRRTRAYSIWRNMLTRCTNPKSVDFERYGGRGITICESWLKFENFLADMGEPPKDLTIDRINNDAGYFKENCAWKTRLDQARNRRKRRPRKIV